MGDLFRGTLDMLILRTLQGGPAHGFAIVQSIASRSDDRIRGEPGPRGPVEPLIDDRR